MNNKRNALNIVLAFGLISIILILNGYALAAEAAKANQFEDSVLASALEKGNSLVMAKILSIETVGQEKNGQKLNYYYYKVLVKPIVIGDMNEADCSEQIELFGGTNSDKEIRPGSAVAIFILKDAPNFFSWSYRNDFVRLSGDTKSLQKKAQEIYSKTEIKKFRESKPKETAVTNLPEGLAEVCSKFKNNPTNRTEYAKEIYASDLGTKSTEAPKIVLTRGQIISILGQPTIKCGWSYKWSCGKYRGGMVGIITVTFDKDEKTVSLIYSLEDEARWVQSAWGK